MLNLLAAAIALVLALIYVGVLVVQVQTVPLWIVIAIGIVSMVASLIDSLREEGVGR